MVNMLYDIKKRKNLVKIIAASIAVFITLIFNMIIINNNFIFLLVTFLGVSFLFFYVYFVIDISYKAICFFTLLLIFQNFFLIIISPYISKSVFNLLVLIKEVFVVLVIICSYIKSNNKQNKIASKKNAVVSIVILIGMFFASSSSFMARVTSFRQLIIPFLLFIFGCCIKLENDQIYKYLRFVVYILVFTSIFGIIEYLYGDDLWHRLGILNYIEKKGQEAYLGVRGLPLNFYTFDLFYVFNKAFRRTVSFIVDPVALGQIFAFAIPIVLFNKILFNNIKRYICLFFLLVGLVLTFGKGGMLIVAISFVYCLQNLSDRKYLSKILAILVLIASIFVISYSNDNNLSTSNHFYGLIENISNLSKYPLGRGMGNAGNFATLYNESDDVGPGESFVGNVIGQLGVIGICIYTVFFYFLIKELEKCKKTNIQDKMLSIPITGNLIGLIVCSFLSGTSISFISSALYFILIGVIMYNNNKSERYKVN